MFVASLALSLLLAQHPATMSPEAWRYLNRAVDVIQTNSLKRETDWVKLRARAIELASMAQSPKDTYPAIRQTLRSLGDHHSNFLDPDTASGMKQGEFASTGLNVFGSYVVYVTPGSPGDRAGVKTHGKIVSVGGKIPKNSHDSEKLFYAAEDAATANSPVDLDIEDTSGTIHNYKIIPAMINLVEIPRGRRTGDGIGYLDVPAFVGSPQQSKVYATALQNLIKTLDTQGVRGWIVDLRQNTGGNCYPMIAGLGPLLGEGTLGYFVSPTKTDSWWYRAGRSGEAHDVCCKVDRPYHLRSEEPPIAILGSSYTASSGEITMISFLGMPKVKIFGEPTQGLVTGNDLFKLSDGALIILTCVNDADRNHKACAGPIQPDFSSTVDWSVEGLEGDPMIEQACRWIDDVAAKGAR